MERLWAPWRLAYVADTAPKAPGCFFCRACEAVGEEKPHLLLGRGDRAFVMLNRFPYVNGHLMVAPKRHVGTMDETTAEEGAELWRLTVEAKKVLTDAFRPDGFNIGINQGKVAGAGVLDHLHIHVVPRWNGDVNFMPVMADVRVIPQALESTFDALRPFFLSRLEGK